ncbi:MAG: DMT family transporter [bacterium]|nr:DMT family transporter [bacterium]
MTGGLWAIASGAGFGLFQSFNSRAVRGADIVRSTFVQLLISTVVLSGIAFATEDPARLLSAPSLALVNFFLAGFFHFFLGWTLLNASQKRIGAARTTPLLGAVPLFATVLAVFALRELPGPLVLAGVGLVVVGVAMISGAGSAPRMTSGAHAGLKASLWGLGTALCWAMSPIFIRKGLEGLPSPLLGVTAGLAGSAAAYGLLLFPRLLLGGGGSPAGRPVGREAMLFKLAAGILVGLSTWARWIAVDLVPVAVALALSQVSVPVVLLVSPFVGGRREEQVTTRLWQGSALIIAGSSVLLFYR